MFCPRRKGMKTMQPKSSPRIHVMWNIFHDAFPIRTILCQRGLQIPSLSPFCHEGEEIISHFFLYCNFAKAVWLRSELSINAYDFQQQPPKQWLQNCILSKQIMIEDKMHFMQLVFTTLWTLWLHQFQLIHEGK